MESVLLAVAVAVGVGAATLGLNERRRRARQFARIEAKVDALLAQAGVTFDPLAGVPPEVRAAMADGDYILAIKRYREATGAGLREAKDVIDEVRRRRG
jgi:ribosomal protein L7/L12